MALWDEGNARNRQHSDSAFNSFAVVDIKIEIFVLFLPLSYDVIFLASWDEIVEKFKESKSKVLFGAEGFCWPDEKLKTKYPPIEGSGQKYLNSGMFMGYAKNIYNILTSSSVKDTDDDQLFYTNIYLDAKMREENVIKLDHRSNVFQNLHGNVGECHQCLKFFLHSYIPQIFQAMFQSPSTMLARRNF